MGQSTVSSILVSPLFGMVVTGILLVFYLYINNFLVKLIEEINFISLISKKFP